MTLSTFAFLVITSALLLSTPAQGSEFDGKATYADFSSWRKSAADGAKADWNKAIAGYRDRLKAKSHDDAYIAKAIEAIEAYDEAELYDEVYTAAPAFNTKPNRLLIDAVKGRRPGKALDIAMGQGRNSVYLASQGWDVTGFDVSVAGLKAARQAAQDRSLKITAVHSSDQDFDFGAERWDLIAMIYAIEKRSVLRVRTALKPGGIVVVEAGHKSVSGAPFEYESNELPRIFKGFRILRYHEVTEVSDWGHEPIRLVRFVAQKPLK